MAVTLVQSIANSNANSANSITTTFASGPTTGNLMVAVMSTRGSFPQLSPPSGWTEISSTGVKTGGNTSCLQMFYRIAEASEPSAVTVGLVANYKRLHLSEWNGASGLDASTTLTIQDHWAHETALSIGPLTPTASQAAVAIAAFSADTDTASYTPGSGWTELDDAQAYSSYQPRTEIEYKIIASTTGSYTADCTAPYNNGWGAMLAIFTAAADPPDEPEGGLFLDFGDGFTDLSADLISYRVWRGSSPEITGGASPGGATLILQNLSDQYNPENTGGPYYTMLRDGIPVWFGMNSDGRISGDDPRGLFAGRVTTITPLPSPGASLPPTVEFACEDALGWMSRVPIVVDAVEGFAQDSFRSAVLDAAGEANRDLDNEITTIQLAMADGKALDILEQLNKANGTRHFAKPADNWTDWYSYTTRNRQWRLDGTTDASLSQEDDHVVSMNGWKFDAGTVINQQKATSTPVRFTPATYTVWKPAKLPLRVTVRAPFDQWVTFDNYVRDAVVDSSYSGATPTIELVPFGDRAHLTITVASGICRFQHLSIEGALAKRRQDRSHIANDTTSQALPRGIRSGGDISGDYVGTFPAAVGIAEHVVYRYGDPQVRPTVTVANWIPEMFERDLFDVISYTSPQLGVTSRHCEIVGLVLEGTRAAYPTGPVYHTATYTLQESREQTDPGRFLLDTSLLDQADTLAY